MSETFRAIQYTDEANSESDAKGMLQSLSVMDGYLGGRIMPPSPSKPFWRLQAFFEHDGKETGWLPEGMRRVIVPKGMVKSLNLRSRKEPQRKRYGFRTTSAHNPPIHKSVRDLALKHRINIVRDEHGYYHITLPDGYTLHSMQTTAQSGQALIRKYLRSTVRQQNPSEEPTEIYAHVVSIIAIKGPNHRCDPACKRANHTYEHKFKRGTKVWGMPDHKSIVLSPTKPQ